MKRMTNAAMKQANGGLWGVKTNYRCNYCGAKYLTKWACQSHQSSPWGRCVGKYAANGLRYSITQCV